MNIKLLPKDFDWNNYLLLNTDLTFTKEEDCKNHYFNHGINEDRKYILDIPDDFDWKIYLEINPDLAINCSDKYNAINHYIKYGRNENRQYKKINCKEKFRKICLENINYIRNIELPDFKIKSIYESVLIEYRCMPQLEFLIRNTIIKLGEDWCHTVVCGNLNYSDVVEMCSKISSKIDIIKTDYDNLSPSEYSKFLTTLDFWNLLSGEKILIYQEDSIIFKNNIKDFFKWDYIGAPWPKTQNDTKSGVGNGGISLRTRSIMIQIINKITIENTKFNSSTLEYTKQTNSSYPPEDVYFVKNMEDFGVGLIADRKNASNFSTESVVNINSFAGHNFWVNDINWEDRIYDNCIIQLKPTHNIKSLEHRGGWSSVINYVINNNFYNEKSNIYFFDTIENFFLWDNKDFLCTNNWFGIIHCTHKTPKYLDIANINNLFINENFIKSLPYCKGIIVLSDYLKKFIDEKFKELSINIKTYFFKHPCDVENILYFDMNKYILNRDKKLLQIGQQLRKLSSIYLINDINHKKMWLTGTKNFEKCKKLLIDEVKHYNINKNLLDKNLTIKYTNTFREYDELLEKNIVFIELIDASANNTIIECIIRNTPIIVNKLEAVVEYLGEDYPLYFENLEDVPLLLSNEKIIEAHNYLCNLNKSEYYIDFFCKKVLNIFYNEIQKI
jgi:hypothetical protein